MARYGLPGLRILTTRLLWTGQRLVLPAIVVALLGLIGTPTTGSAAGSGGIPALPPAGPLAPAATYCASGTVWTDYNIDGSFNNGETGSGRSGFGIEVDYYFAGWHFSGSTTTDGNGNWQICGLNPLLSRRAVMSLPGGQTWTGTSGNPFGFYMGAGDVNGINFGVAQADLSTSFSTSPGTTYVSQDSAFTFYMNWFNSGPTWAHNVQFVFTPPGSMNISSQSCISNGFDIGTGGLQCYASGTVDVNTPDYTTITASGSTSSNTADPNSGNNSSSGSITFRRTSDLSITKSASAPVFIGEDISYQIKVTNNGPDRVVGTVFMNDTVPTNTVFKSLTFPAGWSCTTPSAGGTGPIACSRSSPSSDGFNNGAVANFSLIVTSQAGLQAGTSIVNTATTSASTGFDPNGGNNSATSTLKLSGKANLVVTQTDNPDPVYAGNDATYNVKVHNSGPDSADTPVLSLTVPVSMTFKSITIAPGWSCPTPPAVGGTGTFTCSGASLGNDGDALFSVQYTVNPFVADGTTIFHSVQATSNTFDIAPGDNLNSEATMVYNRSNLSVVVTATPDPATAGANLQYNLTVKTVGPSVAWNARVTDTLPFATSLNSIVTSRGSCTSAPGTDFLNNPTTVVSCNLGNMTPKTPSGSAFVNINVRVGPGVADQSVLFNDAQTTSDFADPDTSDNSADTSTNVNTRANMVVTQSDNPDPAIAGLQVTYTIGITNAGSSYANTVLFTDTLPISTSVASMTTTTGSCNTGTLVCSLGTMVDSASATVVLVLNIAPDLEDGTRITNTATVSTATVDPDTSNNTSLEGTKIIARPELQIAKGDDPDPVVAGTNLTYTIWFTNAGPSFAHNVTISDTLPQGLSFVTITSPYACSQGQFVLCAVGVFTNGVSSQVSIVTHVDINTQDQTRITNTAQISTTNLETNYANNLSAQQTLILGLANLSIQKFDFPDPEPAGTNMTYTLVVANAGPSQALNVVVSDPLPPEATAVSTDSTQGSCSGTTLVTCGLGTVIAGPSIIITIVAAINITPPATGLITNTASVTATTIDPDASDNSSTQVTRVIPRADLELIKLDKPDPVVAGTFLTYTLWITNTGPHDAQNVRVVDVLNPALTFVTVTVQPSWACDLPVSANTISCLTPTLAYSTGAAITVLTYIDPSTADGLQLVNTASVGSDTFDLDLSNNTYTQTTQVVARPDLLMLKTASPEPAIAGTVLTYTLFVSNTGPSTARSVRVADVLSTALGLINVVPDTGFCTGVASLVCNFGTLLPQTGAQATVTVFIDPSIRGRLLNQATVTSNEADPNTDNNTALITSTVIGVADLAISKSASPDPVIAGTPLTYTIWITNSGPSTALGVRLTDTLPSGVLTSSVYNTRGTCVNALTLTCDLGALLPRARTIVSVTVNVKPDSRIVITNTARVATSDTDPALLNNTSVITTKVDALVDMSISKSDFPDPVIAGTPLTYTLLISNAGPSTALAPLLTETLPVSLTGVTVSGPAACGSGPVMSCTLSNLGPNASMLLVLHGKVDPSARGVFGNVAAVGPVEPDSDSSNNSTQLVTTTLITLADVSVVKRGGEKAFVFTYTAVVSNAGPSTATAIQVLDQMPAGLVVDSLTMSQGDCSTATGIQCTIDALLPAGTALLTIVAHPVPIKPGVYTNTVSVSAVEPDPDTSNNASSASATIYGNFLPYIVHDYPLPDLTVSFIGSTQYPHVNIKNIGPLAVTTPFYVDMYVNPSTLPKGPSDCWYCMGSPAHGAVWGINASALPILPGQEMTLTLGDQFFIPALSNVAYPLPVGTKIYAQVDVLDYPTLYGNVFELDEARGTYNNIAGPVILSVGGTVPVIVNNKPLDLTGLPPRRRR